MSKKSCPILYNAYTMKIGQDCMDREYYKMLYFPTCRWRPAVRPPAAVGGSVIRRPIMVGCPIMRGCGWGPIFADRSVHLVVDNRVLLLVARRKGERCSYFYLKYWILASHLRDIYCAFWSFPPPPLLRFIFFPDKLVCGGRGEAQKDAFLTPFPLFLM